MNEIVHLVSQKTGLPEDKARQAAEVVLGYLKDKLPGPLAGQLNQFIGGAGNSESSSSGALGQLFGEKAS